MEAKFFLKDGCSKLRSALQMDTLLLPSMCEEDETQTEPAVDIPVNLW